MSIRITKEEAELISMDLAELTRREVEETLSGAEPTAIAIKVMGGGKVPDDEVRLRHAAWVKKKALERMKFCCIDSTTMHELIEQLDAHIANLSQKEALA